MTAATELIDSCTLSAPGRTWMRTDDRAIPVASLLVDGTEHDFLAPRQIGTTVLDTGYGDLRRDADGLARVKLTAPGGSTAVTVWQDKSYPYLMLFTGDTIKDPERRRRGLAVEPMTCAPNAFRSGDGLIMLAPGQTFEGSWGISPR